MTYYFFQIKGKKKLDFVIWYFRLIRVRICLLSILKLDKWKI